MEYNDSSFYFSLYLLDTYLSRIISDEITDRELFLVVLGFFLISSKYITILLMTKILVIL